MQFLFIVQGEGRGHCTQAIALQHLLQQQGHTIAAVAVGHGMGKTLPAWVAQSFTCPVVPFVSPHLTYHPTTNALQINKTVRNLWQHRKAYLQSIRQLEALCKHYAPQQIINFYEPLGGITNLLAGRKLGANFTVIGHQYLVQHTDFPAVKGFFWQRLAFWLTTELTALGASQRLALSFTKLPTEGIIRPVPPLLRQMVTTQQPPFASEDFLLVYVSEPNFAKQICAWQQQFPHIKLVCFWHNPAYPAIHEPQPNVVFHQVNATLFLEMMTRCRGVVSTAGFESVAEAFYFGKPVWLVPMPNHFEQFGNAADAVAAGIGLQGQSFDLTEFLTFLEQFPQLPHAPAFRGWVSQWPALLSEMFPANKQVSLETSTN